MMRLLFARKRHLVGAAMLAVRDVLRLTDELMQERVHRRELENATRAVVGYVRDGAAVPPHAMARLLSILPKEPA